MPLRLALLAALACVAAAALSAPAVAAERTGRYLVLLDEGTQARSASSAIARAGVRQEGRSIPALDIVTVDGPSKAIRALRRQPGVARVVPEYRREFRREPNDPAWTATESTGRTPGSTPLQWWLRRERFPEAWDITTGGGATVAVIDSGLDGTHPDLASSVRFGAAFGATSPLHDDDGHGTHVSGLACAATDNGTGVASAGYGCELIVIKAPQLRDGDIVQGIMLAADRGADAISMSFGGGPPSPAIDRAIDFALERDVVMVAAASNGPDQDQGSPGSQLQPGNAPDLDTGRGLVVTAVNFADRRAGTGLGPQISMAAYGFFGGGTDGPPGLLSSYPGNATPREGSLGIAGCDCRTTVDDDPRYAYLQGTSMAVPQVAAAAALIGDLNPDLSAREKLRILKESARRDAGWEPDLGWGILDAYAAVDAARREDRTDPRSVIRSRKQHRMDRRRYIRIRVRGSDPKGHTALVPSEIDYVDVYGKRQGERGYDRVRRLRKPGIAKIRISRPGVYRFYTRAVDEDRNREALPRRADLVTRVSR
ncbi:MAG: S8 family serine peptidase [Thermoleophilaceae bacterium]